MHFDPSIISSDCALAVSWAPAFANLLQMPLTPNFDTNDNLKTKNCSGIVCKRQGRSLGVTPERDKPDILGVFGALKGSIWDLQIDLDSGKRVIGVHIP